MDENFSANLRALCAEQPSVSRVCRDIGLNRQQFNKYLAGTSAPSAHNLLRIARHFGVAERDLFEPHDVFRARRGIEKGSLGQGPMRQLVGAFSAQSGALRRYLGFYHSHFLSPTWPDRVMRSLVWLKEERGAVVTHTYERGDDREQKVRQRVRYSGLAALAGGRIYLIERAFSDDGFFSETILYPPHRQQVQYIRGMTMGVASRPRLSPYASRVIFKRVPEKVSAKDALKSTGVFPRNSAAVDPVVRDFLATDILMA